MFDNTKAGLWTVAVIGALSWTGLAAAADTAPAGGPGGNVLPMVRISAPAVIAAPAGGEPGVVDGAQLPGLLREIGQRQSELTLLELDLKRAELQKKLRELEMVPPALPIQAPLPPAIPNPALPPAVGDAGPEAQAGPLVRRIHKIGDQLVAMLLFPGGDMKNLRSGETIGNGLRIVEILPDAVYVRQADQPRYPLPVVQFRRGGF